MAAETLRPDVQLSCVGLVTCDVLEHDEDPDVSSVTIAATGNNVSTEYGVDFPAPSANPSTSADLQEFRAGVEEFDSGQTGTPQARIELWENGALVRAGTNVNVSVYAVLSFTWDAAELATADGSLVQCKVIGTKSGGSPSSRNTVNIGHIEWNAEVDAGTTDFVTITSTTFGVVTFTPTTTFIRTISVTELGIVTLTTVITFAKVISTTALGVVTVIKKIAKTISPAALGIVSFTKLVKKPISVIAVGVATLSTIVPVLQTISATAVGVVTFTKTVTIAGASKALTRLLTLLGAR